MPLYRYEFLADADGPVVYSAEGDADNDDFAEVFAQVAFFNIQATTLALTYRVTNLETGEMIIVRGNRTA